MKKASITTLSQQTILKIRQIYSLYHQPDYIGIDPLTTLQQFSSRNDLETGGLIAAMLAYGRVEIIIRHIDEIFKRMDNQPFKFITTLDFSAKLKLMHGFKHRFNTGDDIALFLQALAEVIAEFGSVEAYFTAMLQKSENGIAGAISSFSATMKQRAQILVGKLPAGFNFLVPSPETGSACKRINMYLRWMVRPADGIDLGVWKKISTAHLIIPVDTHIAKISRREGLTQRTAADWRMAEEITACLRSIDPADPVRFDFSLCRSGMVELRRDAA